MSQKAHSAKSALYGKMKGYIKATFDLHDVDREVVASVLEDLAREVRNGKYDG